MTSIDKTLATKKTVIEISEAYKKACGMIDEAYLLLQEAEKTLTLVAGKDYDFATIDFYDRNTGPRAAAHIKKRINQSIWKTLLNRLGIRKLLSVKRAKELDERLEKSDLPEPEYETVFELFVGMMQDARELQVEAVQEVFEFLRPSQYWHAKQYKTNERNGKFELGEKIILAGWIDTFWSDRVRGDSEKKLVALDNVFRMLDGAPLSDTNYRSPLIDQINREKTGTTTYFEYKIFNNGNLHLKFRRMDLVQQINRIAGNSTELREPRE